MSRGNLLPYTMDTTRLRCRLSITVRSRVSNRSCRFRAAMEFANDSKAVPWHTGLTGFSVGRNLGTVPSDLDSPKATSKAPVGTASGGQQTQSVIVDKDKSKKRSFSIQTGGTADNRQQMTTFTQRQRALHLFSKYQNDNRSHDQFQCFSSSTGFHRSSCMNRNQCLARFAAVHCRITILVRSLS